MAALAPLIGTTPAGADPPAPTWAAEYFSNTELTGSPTLTRTDPAVSFDWGVDGTPDTSIPLAFSARWTGTITTQAGLYRFDTMSDDGARVYVDGILQIDHWGPQPLTEWQADVTLTAGDHTVVMEYQQFGGAAVARLSYGLIDSSAAPAGQWKAEYFANMELAAEPVIVRNDASINYDWGLGSPDPGLPSSNFSIRWTQTLTLPAGTYRFNTNSDDGVRVFADGAPVINNWTPHSLTFDTGDIVLGAGTHTFVVEYFQGFGSAIINANWAQLSPPGFTRINAGGTALIDSHNQYWEADTFFTGGVAAEETQPIWNTDDDPLYINERATPHQYNIPMANGAYVVRLHMAELFFNSPGVRRFNATIEGVPVLSSFDIYANAGKASLITKSFPATVTDGSLNITFTNVFDNATVHAIDVVPAAAGLDTTAPVFVTIPEAENVTYSTPPAVTLNVTDDVALNDGYWRLDDQDPQPLFDDENGPVYNSQFTMPVEAFNDLPLGSHTLSIGSNDTTGNASVQTWKFRKLLTGGGSEPIAFDKRELISAASPLAPLLKDPTSVQFGPDGKLYVTNLNGYIHVMTLDASHNVTAVTRIDTIHDTPNFNDDGTPVPTLHARHTIGLAFDPQSTPDNPIIWVVHSDPRFCFNKTPATCPTDTNSGILSRLEGPNFDLPASRADVVTGLPRSRENHSPNSLHFGPDGWLYMSIGSNTNFGAPSLAFSFLPETYLTAAVVRFNVNGAPPSSFPFDARTITSAAGMQPGIFELYATGYRNAYDFLFHPNGKLYINSNRGNFTAGNTPGPADGCPDGVSFDPGTRADDLSIVEQGDYGGGPNPARGECVLEDGTVYDPDLPAQANYRAPIMYYGPNGVSANGMNVYRAQTFGGQMYNNLLAVMWAGDSALKRVVLSADGNSVLFSENLAIFNQPLSVTSSQDGAIFVTEYDVDTIQILEPVTPLTGAWASLAPHPDPAGEPAITACGGKVYVFGGLIGSTQDTNAAWSYDPATNAWVSLAPYPGTAVDHGGAACVDGKVYLIGGLVTVGVAVKQVLEYDPATDTWTPKADLPFARGAMGVTTLNGKIYTTGGLGYPAKNDLFSYTPSTNTWQTLAPMPTARDHVTLAEAGGKLYAIGGRNVTADSVTPANEMYDPATNTWASRAPMPVPSAGMSSGMLDGRIQLWGGEAPAAGGGLEVRPTGYQFDPSTNSWISIAGQITPRHGSYGATIDDKVYVPVGIPQAGSGVTDVNEVFTFVDTSAPVSCIEPGTDPRVTDSDNDGYTDQDETDNNTDPCNPSSIPPDHNDNGLSDLNDPDDDSDAVPDTEDQLQFDALNGSGTPIPFALSFSPTDPPPGTGMPWDTGSGNISFGNSGFPGWQLTSFGTGFIKNNVHEGGAGGFLSLDATAGTNAGPTNAQDNALQVGYDATNPVSISARIATPFSGLVVEPGKSAGIFAGIDEDNFVKLVITADNGTGQPGLALASDSNGVHNANNLSAPVNLDLIPIETLDLALDLDPAAETITARYRINSDVESDWLVAGTLSVGADPDLAAIFRKAGDPATSTAIPWSGGSLAGVIATKGTALSPFGAAYKNFRIDPLAVAASGTLTALVATSPAADTHQVNVLLDGVPIGAPMGNGQTSGPISFPAGPHTVSVTGAGDTNLANYLVLYWGNCTIDGSVTIPSNGSVGCAVILIHKASPLPTLSISDPQIVRPASGTAQAVFTITRSGVSWFPIRVNYDTQDGSAMISTGDYTATSGSLTFDPSGPSTQTVSVPVSPTARHSVSDTFDLVLSSVSAATLADNVGTAQLINRNGLVSIYAGDVDVVRSTSTTTNAVFPLSLSAAPAPGEQVTVKVNTTNGTAVAGTDYTKLPSTTVTFGAGEQTKTVTIPVAPQPGPTPARAFNLVLKNPSANAVLADTKAVARLRSSGSATPAPTAYVSDVTLLRPVSGSGSAVFTVSLSAASTSTVTVKYATQNGSATVAAGDYTATSGTLTFAPGQVTKTVPVTVFPTARHALGHGFTLKLSAPSGTTLADNLGTATLIDLHGRLAISAADIAVVRSASAGNTATITVGLSAAPAIGESVTVNVATANGSAIAGADYTALATTTVTFAPGQQTATVTVPIAAAAAGTPARLFTLGLSTPSSNAFISDTAATVSLIGP
jgi:glucose/arabinose dehydrogenase/N-acetylneuraminic acid mutarotase